MKCILSSIFRIFFSLTLYRHCYWVCEVSAGIRCFGLFMRDGLYLFMEDGSVGFIREIVVASKLSDRGQEGVGCCCCLLIWVDCVYGGGYVEFSVL